MKAAAPKPSNRKSPVREGKIQKKKGMELDEMTECFLHLREIVPTIPRDRKLSKVEILQHVIDYIVDLQLALEGHPLLTPPPRMMPACVNRVPLGECTIENTTFTEHHGACSMSNKCPVVRPESCETRPVSC
ncbi:PREDICTED: DNA-binding protein inhibitor ID-2-like [Priapulus caudatus]|uniref:DNA-binding protein inhibitor ID-2-like n=1 Tax=Priapulus caudatus TaxID=37621 RepID=A0ABM1DSV7_PRICU|nr:PREDICTED: DNA-binding protein inhibitor ID-2-like [Priapulus caudatus]